MSKLGNDILRELNDQKAKKDPLVEKARDLFESFKEFASAEGLDDDEMLFAYVMSIAKTAKISLAIAGKAVNEAEDELPEKLYKKIMVAIDAALTALGAYELAGEVMDEEEREKEACKDE